MQTDSLFTEIQFETLHVYAGMTQALSSSRNMIPSAHLEHFSFYKKGMNYSAVHKFSMDKNRKYNAYLIKMEGDTSGPSAVYILVFQTDGMKLIFESELAVYQLLASSFERTQNAWIADFDGDGIMDIGVHNQLIDFEKSIPEAPNSSGSKQFMYRFKNGKYEMESWNYDILKKYALIKGNGHR
ncbi:MAG: hypothetical protein HZC28_03845 [Spirochaetes bacterium]|nr:hypothetical protein [Spirochaetota bacterium]